MPYLLDADVFIRAAHQHYRFAVCPGYWDWLLKANTDGVVYSIEQVQTELSVGNDALAAWAAAQSPAFFLSTDPAVAAAAQTVSSWAAQQSYEAQAVNAFFAAADYWLVAQAFARGWAVVTHERSHPDSKRRIMLPDACNGLGVAWEDPFQLLENEGARFVLP
jgi:hypothetical protein